MASVLIHTFPDDAHAVVVALALRDLGHDAVLWHGTDFPTREFASMAIDQSGLEWQISSLGSSRSRGPFDVVWHRRPTSPVLPSDMHPADRPIARTECEAFVASLRELVAPDAFQVNPPAGNARARSKPAQLLQATRAGLEIPRTLVSNDPSRIRAFLAEASGPTIFKPFSPAEWRDGDNVALLLTNTITLDDLPDDEILRLTPGIFQPMVAKAHELRIIYMGGRTFAARLLSQRTESTRVDARANYAELVLEPDTLPEWVRDAIDRLMNSLGLVFGCLDFIVTPDGRYIFLEVNSRGQFLWVEHALPELPLLDAFCHFLVGRESRFTYRTGPRTVHDRDYIARVDVLLADNAARHVAYAPDNLIDESACIRDAEHGMPPDECAPGA